MDNLNSEVLKFPVQESCGEEEEKDSRPEEIKEKMRRLENGSHSEELSFRSTLENTSSVAQSLDHDTETFLLPYGIQCTEDVEKFEGVQAGSSLKHFKRTNKWFVIRDRKRQFWEVKLPEFPAQPFKKRRIENGDPRARKQILPRGCKRKFGEVKDRKSPSQPLKKKKIGNEGGRLVERSEKGCRTHWGHENNHPCSNLFDPGGSHQANSQVGEMGVIHLVFALQILRL